MPAVVQGLRSAGRVLRIWSAVLQLLLWLWLELWCLGNTIGLLVLTVFVAGVMSERTSSASKPKSFSSRMG